MEHSVDLSAKTFVQAISPSSPRRILKKIKKILKKTDVDGSDTLDIDDLDGRLAGFNFDDESDDEGNEAEDSEGDDAVKDDAAAADSIGKALALIKQVRIVNFIRIYIKNIYISIIDPRVSSGSGIFCKVLSAGWSAHSTTSSLDPYTLGLFVCISW